MEPQTIKPRLLRLIGCCCLLLVFNSCYYDVAEELYTGNNCPTPTVSYSIDVMPLLKANCGDGSCHVGGQSLGGVNFDNHNTVSIEVKNGSLLNAIKHAPGFSAMPQGAAKLSDADILTIETWINECATDN